MPPPKRRKSGIGTKKKGRKQGTANPPKKAPQLRERTPVIYVDEEADEVKIRQNILTSHI